MKIENVQVIVHENEERKLYIHDVGAVDEVVATVALKVKIDGELYGDYIVFKKPTITVPEVVEAVNYLLQTVIVNLTKGGNHMKRFNKRLRYNSETNLFHTREDIKQLMDYCNFLADKINELIDENDRLKREIADAKSATWHE